MPSVHLHCLAAAALAAFAGPATAADPGSPSTDTVVVSGMRPAGQAPMPSTIEAITALQIDETVNSPTVAGMLQYLPSVHVRERYIGDRNGVLVMRLNSSIASAQTAVYADGLLLSNYLNNSFSTAPRWGMVSPEEVDRIEVIYGPFSALYPGNSAAGVVRMITRTPTRFEAHVKLEAFDQRFRLYGADDHFGGGHANAALGHAIGDTSVWISLDHLANRSQPQTFGNTTAKSGAPAVAGSFTDVSGSPVYRDIDTANRPRIIVSTTGIDETVQDMAKFKLAQRFGPGLRAEFVLGLWRNDSEGRVDSYLRDAQGRTVFNAGSTISSPLKFIRLDGVDYTVSAAVPSASRSEHRMQAVSLQGQPGTGWEWELAGSRYDMLRDTVRTATPVSGYDSGLGEVRPGGQLTDARGTGWSTIDARAQWRGGNGTPHVLSLGAHRDHYALESVTYGTSAQPIADWLTSETGTLSTNSFGQTQTSALYLQDEWQFAPQWNLIVGARQERWRAFGGSNYNSTNLPPNPKNIVYPDRSYSNFSPKVYLAWQAAPDLALRASIGKGVRYPTVAEMYQTFTGPNGIRTNDPNLKPEQVVSQEWVVQRQYDHTTWRASAFFEDKRDALITQTDVTVTPNITSVQNVDRVRTQGVEIAFQTADLGVRGLDLNGSLTYAHSLITEDSRNPGLEGTVQPRIPDWRATLVATWHATDAWTGTLAWRYSGRQHNALFNTTTGQYNDPNPDVYGAVSRYSVFDARLVYRFTREWSGSFGVNNLSSTRYYVNPNPYPQRTLFAGVAFDL